jgi:hypothetical protein
MSWFGRFHGGATAWQYANHAGSAEKLAWTSRLTLGAGSAHRVLRALTGKIFAAAAIFQDRRSQS